MGEYKTGFSGYASLVVVGVWMQRVEVWRTVEGCVHIKQKVISYKPSEKLLDALINILAGGHGLVEINTRVRPDRQLQRAFGREGCPDQSIVSDTLNACTEENVEQMREANQEILHIHSKSWQHDHERAWQALDVDMTGMPAGRQGERVTKGCF